MKMQCSIVVAGLSLAASHAIAVDEHFDVAPFIEGGKVMLDGVFHDYPAEASIPQPIAYGYELGEFPNAANAVDDPGFNIPQEWAELSSVDYHPETINGTTFAFDTLGGLLYWDGTGSPAFSPASAPTFLYLFQGGNELFLQGSTAGVTSGFDLITFDSIAPGADDAHLNTQLWGGDPLDGATWVNTAPAGVYVATLQVRALGFETSDPIYIVYNFGADEQAHEAAIASFIPEPAALGLIALGVPMLMRRRRA